MIGLRRAFRSLAVCAAVLVCCGQGLACSSEPTEPETVRAAQLYYAAVRRERSDIWLSSISSGLAQDLKLNKAPPVVGPGETPPFAGDAGTRLRLLAGAGAPWKVESWTEIQNDGQRAVVELIDARERKHRIELVREGERWLVDGPR